MNQMRLDRLGTASEAETVEGVVDGVEGGTLRGWAWYPGNAQRIAKVTVQAGATVLAEAEAMVYRGDLAAAGKRNGHCAFAIALPLIPDTSSALSITVDGKPLSGSPLSMPAPSPKSSIEHEADVLPLPLGTGRLSGSLDACGPSRIRGWAHWLDATHPVTLRLLEGDREWLRIQASQWRADLAELRQGDGSCGFDLPLPDALCDGKVHVLDLRAVDHDEALLPRPFRMRTAPVRTEATSRARPSPEALQRRGDVGGITLSVIVNFYNMSREAARTLASLSRHYQEGIGELDYEVLCIDNGSQPPLDPAWVASFGPEFRLIRPSRLHSSPCSAINAAALEARGRYLAVMIDGAHLLTPGVFREALGAWREDPEAVVAVRHWFIGGDQRWLAMAGYSTEQEDRLFDRIRWPSNGYELFRIGAPIGESPEPWFDGLSESNCLMLPTALYDRMGGMDEAFDDAGGGFANLDLCRRASSMANAPTVSLVGEASFHQFHGGTTTNVDDAAKDERVRGYARAYRTLRGEEFTSIHRAQLKYRGSMPSEFATGVRQRVLVPMRLGVTENVRPSQLALHFDDGAQTYLQSVYAEAGLHDDVTWLGQPVGVAPADLISLQNIIFQVRPDAVITIGAQSGMAQFTADVLRAAGSTGARLLHVNPGDDTKPSPVATTLQGDPADARLLATVRHWAGSAECVLVMLSTSPAAHFTTDVLSAYGNLVSHRSYLVCLGTVFGQPWLGYSRHQHLRTVREFINGGHDFVVDRSHQRQLLTTCPSGYLRKVGGAVTAATYDPSLDAIGPSTSSETFA